MKLCHQLHRSVLKPPGLAEEWYCMRPLGHEGKHSPFVIDEDVL